jgi:hypothetical protein
MNEQKTYTQEDIENILGKPNTIVGYRRNGSPIYNIAGGSINFEGGDDDDDKGRRNAASDDDDDDDDDELEEEEDDYVPPTKEAWEKLLAEKRKVDSESAARKRLLREAGINPKDGSPLKPVRRLSAALDEPEDDEDAEEAASSAKPSTKRTVDSSEDAKALQKRLQREMERNLLDAEADVRKEERDRSRTLMSAIPEALNTEGWNGKAMPRILKLLDLDALEVDEDGVTGLDEQVTELKRDFPEFFKRTRMKDAAEKVADRRTAGGGAKKTSPAKVDGTWAENIARALHGEG